MQLNVANVVLSNVVRATETRVTGIAEIKQSACCRVISFTTAIYIYWSLQSYSANARNIYSHVPSAPHVCKLVPPCLASTALICYMSPTPVTVKRQSRNRGMQPQTQRHPPLMKQLHRCLQEEQTPKYYYYVLCFGVVKYLRNVHMFSLMLYAQQYSAA